MPNGYNYDIDFQNENEEVWFAQANLGMQATDFLDTDLGKVLKGYAQQEIQECALALLTVKIHDEETIASLQMRAMAARNFLRWIEEAIVTGENAHQMLLQNSQGG